MSERIQKDLTQDFLPWSECKKRLSGMIEIFLEELGKVLECNDQHLLSDTPLRVEANSAFSAIVRQLFSLEYYSERKSSSVFFSDSFSRKFILEAREDIAFALSQDPAARSWDEVVHCYPGVQALHMYRLANFFWELGFFKCARLISFCARVKFGVDIHPGAQIGVPCFLDHAIGIVIGETASVGNRVAIYHGVTLGSCKIDKSLAHSKRHPTVLDDARIYANACILGGDTIVGRGASVGAACLVTASIPNECIFVQHRRRTPML